MRDYLRANKIYIRKKRGIAISQALIEIVQKDTSWPEDNEERSSTKPRIYPQQAQVAIAIAVALISTISQIYSQQ